MGNVLEMCCGSEEADSNAQKRPRVNASKAPGAMTMDNTPSAEERRAQMAAAALERERQNAVRGTKRETPRKQPKPNTATQNTYSGPATNLEDWT